MSIRIGSSDFMEMFPIFLGILVGIMVIAWVFIICVKRQDDRKELTVRKVKVLERPVQQGNLEWYVVECENGERLRLRSFQANNIIIEVGDVGVIGYKGQTIQTFRRED